MTKGKRELVVQRFPDEQLWIRSFVAFYGTENVTRYCEDDLNGIFLVQVLEALTLGTVVSAEKCDGPGTNCTIVYNEGYSIIRVDVHFVSSEMKLSILSAQRSLEANDEPYDAA